MGRIDEYGFIKSTHERCPVVEPYNCQMGPSEAWDGTYPWEELAGGLESRRAREEGLLLQVASTWLPA